MKQNQDDINYMLSIIKMLKQLREENKVSQEIFYMDTGIHIGRIESGKSNLTLITLKKICDYYKITPKDFFCKIYDLQEEGVSSIIRDMNTKLNNR